MDKDDKKKRERDAKLLIKNLKEDRAKRAEKQKLKDEEYRKKQLADEQEMKDRAAKLKLERWTQKVEKKKAIELAKKERREELKKRVEISQTRTAEVEQKGKPLYKIKEQQYEEAYEIPGLAERKEQLKKIRDFYKPIDIEEMKEHMQAYKHIRKEKNLIIQENRQASLKELRDHQRNLPFKPVRDASMENLPTQKELIAEKANKIDNYAKYVREMYWPKVSVKKQLELEHVKGTLKNAAIRKEDEE